MQENNIYMQFSNCITVKGYTRSAIYDVQRIRYLLIDNAFADLLKTHGNKIPFNKMDKTCKNYISELVEDEWGIFTNKYVANLFPKLNLEWKHYAEITNAQIDFYNSKEHFDYFFQKVLPQLELLSCKALQINFVELIDYKTLHKFLLRFNDTHVHSLLIFLPFISLTTNESSKLYSAQPRLNMLCYYSCPSNVHDLSLDKKSFYSTKDIACRKNNLIFTDYFATNITFFTESQKFNTYYNRKLCISADGEIKNTPEQLRVYGNIRNTLLSEVLKNKEFKSLWTIHKEMIDVCKECEYRHMCVDACNLIKRKDNTWYRSKECNYNPYICKWSHEEGYKTLSECGVKVNEHEFHIENAKLNEICKELWDE
jgi:SPASM domain peptide maturase of grasp-with-spasm system